MLKTSVELNKTFIHLLPIPTFGNLSPDECVNIFKGRPFSHFIEKWLEKNYPLNHIMICKDHDFARKLYSQKQNMMKKHLLQRDVPLFLLICNEAERSFNAEVFKEKSSKLIYLTSI